VAGFLDVEGEARRGELCLEGLRVPAAVLPPADLIGARAVGPPPFTFIATPTLVGVGEGAQPPRSGAERRNVMTSETASA
jgi:hypothetical protein